MYLPPLKKQCLYFSIYSFLGVMYGRKSRYEDDKCKGTHEDEQSFGLAPSPCFLISCILAQQPTQTRVVDTLLNKSWKRMVRFQDFGIY